MHQQPSLRIALIVVTVVASLVAACGSSARSALPPTGTGTAGSPAASTDAAASSRPAQPPSGEPAPSPTPGPTGFAFSADGMIAFYQGRGYTCATEQPSARAAGYDFRTCQATSGGRTLVVGFVTDSNGELGDAWASVQAPADEDFLEPTDALGPLAGFLGATLGADRGAAALEWLAAHLGDDYATTTSGSLTVATYIPSPDDHARIYVEVADEAYLTASPPPNR